MQIFSNEFLRRSRPVVPVTSSQPQSRRLPQRGVPRGHPRSCLVRSFPSDKEILESVKKAMKEEGFVEAAKANGLDLDQFLSNIGTLLTFLPPISIFSVLSMEPAAIAALASNAEKSVERIIELPNIIPGANVESILVERPSVLLDEEWEQIPASLVSLRKTINNDVDIAELVSKNPALLVDMHNSLIPLLIWSLERRRDVWGVKEDLLEDPEETNRKILQFQNMIPELDITGLLVEAPKLLCGLYWKELPEAMECMKIRYGVEELASRIEHYPGVVVEEIVRMEKDIEKFGFENMKSQSARIREKLKKMKDERANEKEE